jgi:transposase
VGNDATLPAFGRATYLRYRPKRYQCQDCEGHPTTTQSLEWHDANSPHSFVYDNHILLQLVNSTVEDVSLKEGLSYASVVGTLEQRMDARVDWTLMADIDTLGLDEIALRKGQGHNVTLVTGRLREGEIVILGVLPGHEKFEVIEFLRSIPQRILQSVQAVCRDLGKPISRQFAKKFQRCGSLQTVSMLPDTTARPQINCENKSFTARRKNWRKKNTKNSREVCTPFARM